MENINYQRRLIDDKIELYMTVLGAISLEGPRGAGKLGQR